VADSAAAAARSARNAFVFLLTGTPADAEGGGGAVPPSPQNVMLDWLWDDREGPDLSPETVEAWELRLTPLALNWLHLIPHMARFKRLPFDGQAEVYRAMERLSEVEFLGFVRWLTSGGAGADVPEVLSELRRRTGTAG
jgi:hypothetical protein